MMNIRFVKSHSAKIPSAAAVVYTKARLCRRLQVLDRDLSGAISAMVAAGRFEGDTGEHLSLNLPADAPFSRLLLIGAGDPDKIDDTAAGAAGAVLFQVADKLGMADITLLEADDTAVSAQAWAHGVALGVLSSSYRFDRYRTTMKPKEKPCLKGLDVIVADPDANRDLWAKRGAIMDGVFLTRDLVSEPSNVLTPAVFADRISDLEKVGVDVEILDLKALEKLKMGALINVGRGSIRPPYVAVMRWRGARQDAPLAFVGKGVTFDTGGISLKPANGMEEMKSDMSGAAVVTGLMRALAARKARVDAVGVVGLVENMPSGNAQNPGDIVTSMSGRTIEVLNTDAEGRLVLADALYYTRTRFSPRLMINLATLTGAIVVALGEEYAGLFSNDDSLSSRIIAAGKDTGERVWPFPLDDVYDKMLRSPVADMQNITGKRGAGSITAAHFLKRFVGKVPWAHLDIAGVSFRKEARGMTPAGASGFGVRLLDRLVAAHYES